MGVIVGLIKWLLILLGAATVYFGALMQFNHGGITGKIVSEIISPSLHDKSTGVYMDMANTLLDTGDITMATIVRDKVDHEALGETLEERIENIEEAMSSVATELQIREVGMLPLSEQVELQTGEKQRFLKIYQYCKPTTAMDMVDYSDAFSAYLPCRIALVQDKAGQLWLYSLNMDMMIYGGNPLPPHLYDLALQVQETITAIQKAGATGDF